MHHSATYAAAALVILPTADNAETKSKSADEVVCGQSVAMLRCFSDLLASTKSEAKHGLSKFDASTYTSIVFH